MNPELLATLVIVPTVAALVAGTWWLTVKLVPLGPRRMMRWYYPAIVLILAVHFVGGYIARSVGRGDFVCVVCGRSTGMITLGALAFEVPVDSARGVGSSDEYERAFPVSGTQPHSHVWQPAGCRLSGCDLPLIPSLGCVACNMVESCAWFRDLPHLKDRQIGSAYADRLRSASSEDRWHLLEYYDHLVDEQPDIDLRFATWREAWRRDHSDWP